MSELPSSTEWRKVFYSPQFNEPTPARSEEQLRFAAAQKGLDFHAWPGGFMAFKGGDTEGNLAHVWVWDVNGRMARSEFLNTAYVDYVSDEQTGERLCVANFAQVYTYDADGNLATAHQVVIDADGNEEPYRNLATGEMYTAAI